MDELHKRGFVHLKSALSPDEIAQGISTIQGQELNYTAMEKFVTGPFLGKIDRKFGWSTVYTKYRVSDNNNSVDASAFHRDIFPINGAGAGGAPPVYTVLTYFDKTVMEVIPGSHNETEMSYWHALQRFSDAERLTIEPGDMLIFHATLLHRGIFTEKQAHRRVLQVFDCFPSNDVFQQYNEKICHIPGTETLQGPMLAIARNPFFVFFSNGAGFLNAATGHGSHFADMRGACSVDAYNYLSSEGLTKRIGHEAVAEEPVQPLNKYYLRDPATVNDLPTDCYQKFKFAYYNKQFILFFIIFTVVLGAILYGGWRLVATYGLAAWLLSFRKAHHGPYNRRGRR
jgi:hypothetical protein